MMVCGKRVAGFLAVLCVMSSCVTKVPEIEIVLIDEEPVYHLPEAGRMYIYESDGIVAFDTRIESSFINSGSFILPPEFFTEGIIMFQDGERLYTYSMEKARVLVEHNNDDEITVKKENVTKVYAPEIIDGIPVDIKYSARYRKGYDAGISWKMILDIQLRENNMLNCGLFAELNSDISLPLMDVSLANNKGVTIPAGKLRIAPQKIDYLKMETAKVPYQIMYDWDTDDQEYAYTYIYMENPFATKMDGVRIRLNENGVKIDSNSDRINLISGKPIKIYLDQSGDIKTNRSVSVSEHKERKDLPFTHSVRYTAKNNTSDKIVLNISIPVVYGTEHKTQYHFTKEPDARPGDRMIWRFELENEETAIIEFTFDADIKDVYMYHHYDYSEGGR
jgi:hypothetical protein